MQLIHFISRHLIQGRQNRLLRVEVTRYIHHTAIIKTRSIDDFNLWQLSGIGHID
ncbi:Uncharacterised protein [Vibrio cholerae]|nr:Uncharacterised protein [Vibrio cholerae]